MSAALKRREEPGLRAWLEYVAETAIDMLDALDAADDGLEDDEREDDREWAQ